MTKLCQPKNRTLARVGMALAGILIALIYTIVSRDTSDYTFVIPATYSYIVCLILAIAAGLLVQAVIRVFARSHPLLASGLSNWLCFVVAAIFYIAMDVLSLLLR